MNNKLLKKKITNTLNKTCKQMTDEEVAKMAAG